MPLPQALLARLKKRGIVKASQPELEEEVIVEDYDDNDRFPSDTIQRKSSSENGNNMPQKDTWVGCPNKWNIYHECNDYCRDTWGSGREKSSPKTEHRRLLMLKKYPLPDAWEEVYDPGVARHYYWNTKNDEVAWFPPLHPKCKTSLPAEKLRALIKDNFLEPMDEGDDQEQSDSEEDSEDEDMMEELERTEKHFHRERAREKYRGKPKVRENDLDPMDPASYSEAPRGTWSSGLERKGEAKTGVDTTASGPLFQMRPYPSPGAVLKMNAEIKHKDPSDMGDT